MKSQVGMAPQVAPSPGGSLPKAALLVLCVQASLNYTNLAQDNSYIYTCMKDTMEFMAIGWDPA